jgi:hypothetical protein
MRKSAVNRIIPAEKPGENLLFGIREPGPIL